jgi:hypothetical protein
MTNEQKKLMIEQIMLTLKDQAYLLGKNFDAGIFFNLIFMTDKELIKIKKLCNI